MLTASFLGSQFSCAREADACRHPLIGVAQISVGGCRGADGKLSAALCGCTMVLDRVGGERRHDAIGRCSTRSFVISSVPKPETVAQSREWHSLKPWRAIAALHSLPHHIRDGVQ